jgi:hypothetical protein
MPKVPIPLPPELEENAKAPAPEPEAGIQPVRVGPLTFRAPTFGDLETLRLIGSPYYRQLVGPGAVEDFRPDLGALMDVAFLWSRPARECLALASRGADAFRAASSRVLVDAPLAVGGELEAAVSEVLARGLGAE